jgi:carbon monoxide dehydrogenase subunit G
MSWKSAKLGDGSMTISEFVANQKVASTLDFGAMGKAASTMTLEAAGAGTKVTWGFASTQNGPIERWFGLMIDRWVGADYEKGLTALKTLAEKA